MNYPRRVVLEDKKLAQLLREKGVVIDLGRDQSHIVEHCEAEMQSIDEAIQLQEKSVDISEFKKEAEELTERINAIMAEMKVVQDKIYAKMKAAVDPELGKRYEEVKKRKEEAEIERNKQALKAQKYTDRIIPIARNLMKPFLEAEGDDYETIKIENGEVVATIFNHFDDFRKRYLSSLGHSGKKEV